MQEVQNNEVENDKAQLFITAFIGSLLVGIASFFSLTVNVVYIAMITLLSHTSIEVFFGPFTYHIFMIIQAILIAFMIGVVFRLLNLYKAYLISFIVVPVTLFAHFFLYFSLGSVGSLANIFSAVLAFIISFCLFLFIIFLFYQSKK